MQRPQSSVGQILRQQRSKLHVSLDDAAAELYFPKTTLSALEEDRFDDLPNFTYIQAYLHRYSEYLQLDSQAILALLRRDYQPAQPQTPQLWLKPRAQISIHWTSLHWMGLVIGVFFSVSWMYVGVKWWQFQQPPLLVVTQPSNDAVVGPQVTILGRTTPEAQVAINSQPVSLQPDGEFSYELFLSREGSQIITLSATDRRGRTNTEQLRVVVEF